MLQTMQLMNEQLLDSKHPNPKVGNVIQNVILKSSLKIHKMICHMFQQPR